MSKRSRVNRSDSFDQPSYPNKSSSTNNPNKFSKPSSALSGNAEARSSSSVGEPKYISEFLKECFRCKAILELKYDTHMYNSNPYCSLECRGIQMDLDEELEKKQMKESGKKN